MERQLDYFASYISDNWNYLKKRGEFIYSFFFLVCYLFLNEKFWNFTCFIWNWTFFSFLRLILLLLLFILFVTYKMVICFKHFNIILYCQIFYISFFNRIVITIFYYYYYYYYYYYCCCCYFARRMERRDRRLFKGS